MEVNAQKIKQLRNEKSWTQQHLADACGISLRTIQRVERYGNSSHETVMSLAAVFELHQHELVNPNIELKVAERVIELDAKVKRQLIIKACAFGVLIGVVLTTLLNIFFV